MKSVERMRKIEDSDLYFATALILWAFDKNGFAILAFCIACLLGFTWRSVEKEEKRNGEKEKKR